MFARPGRRPAWAIRALLALGLLCCAQTAMIQAATAQTLRMWSILSPTGRTPREIVFGKLIAGFEAANPGVKIQVEPQDFRTMGEKFLAAHQSGTAPDIMWVYTTVLNSAIKAGALANLDELFLKNWSKDDIADVDGPLFQFGATPTAHYQIMHSRNMMGMVYRIDLFKDAGIDPNSLTTWDKFIAAAQKLMEKDAAGTVTRWGFGQSYPGPVPITPILFSVLMDADGTLFDKDMRARWATPAGVKGLQLEVDMIRKYGITPETAVTESSDDNYAQFDAGRAAMARAGAVHVSTAIAKLGHGKVGYLRTPSFTEGKYSPSEGAGWCVTVWSGSKQKELAGKFVEYMSSKAADWQWASEGGALPIRQSTIADHPDFFKDPNNAYLAVAAADLHDRGRFPPEGAGVGGWDEGLNSAVGDVLVNHADPMAALQKSEMVYNRANRR